MSKYWTDKHIQAKNIPISTNEYNIDLLKKTLVLKHYYKFSPRIFWTNF
jgi:hypothetical protein